MVSTSLPSPFQKGNKSKNLKYFFFPVKYSRNSLTAEMKIVKKKIRKGVKLNSDDSPLICFVIHNDCLVKSTSGTIMAKGGLTWTEAFSVGCECH